MSYVTYNTKALVCGSFEQNIADKNFMLFTERAGMLYATGKSVRLEKSKQRAALQDFSRVQISLVKGKGGWRIGSVEALANDFFLAESREARGSVVSLYKFLRRFIRGEEASPELFAFCIFALDFLQHAKAEREKIELLIQLEILRRLGYVAEDSSMISDWDLIDYKSINKDTLSQKIKDATESSHL